MKLGSGSQRENFVNVRSAEANDSKRANSAEDKLRTIALLGQDWSLDRPRGMAIQRKRWERLAEIALDYFV